MSDLENRIVELLREASQPYPLNFIALKLPEARHQEVKSAIDRLKQSGKVTYSSYGVELTTSAFCDDSVVKYHDVADLPNEIAETLSRTIQPGQLSPTKAGQAEVAFFNEPPAAADCPDSHDRSPFAGMSEQAIEAYFESLPWNLDVSRPASNKGEFAEQPRDAVKGDSCPCPSQPLFYCDSIDTLGLSGRTNNALANHGIKTLLDVAFCDSLDNIRGIGRSCTEDLVERLEIYAKPVNDEQLSEMSTWYGSHLPTHGLFFDHYGMLRFVNKPAQEGTRYGQCPTDLQSLNLGFIALPKLVIKKLEKRGISTVNQLCAYSKYDLIKTFGFSCGSVAKVVEELEFLGIRLAPEDTTHASLPTSTIISTPKRKQALNPVAQTAADVLKEWSIPLYEPVSSRWLNHKFDGVGHEEANERLRALLSGNHTELMSVCQAAIYRWANGQKKQTANNGAEPQAFALTADWWWQEAASAICESELDLKLSADGMWIRFCLPSLHDWLETLPNNDTTKALKLRLSGATLQEVGEQLGVTRERARQMQVKALKEAPALMEDGFSSLFEMHRVNRALFCSITNCGPDVYNYLNLKYHRKRQKHHNVAAQQDMSIPEDIRKAIESYLVAESRKSMVKTEHGYVKADRKSAILCAMNRLASSGREIVNSDELFNELKKLVDEKVFPAKIMPGTARNLFAQIQRTGILMAPAQKHLRLHDFSAYDYDDLRDHLEELSENSIECSTRLLFEQWPDLMTELDIRDYKELHYTIKTRLGDMHIGVYSLGRSPMITLGRQSGKSCRTRQIAGLIEEMAPVSRTDLANEYQRRYKVDKNTFLAAFLNDFQQYRLGDYYSIKTTPFTADEMDCVGSILGTHDYFPLSIARQLFRGTFPTSKATVCDESLRLLGYSISESLIVKDGIDLNWSFAKAIADLNKFGEGDEGFSSDVFKHTRFMAALNKKLRSLSLIEYDHHKYVKTCYLDDVYGVAKADIEEFISKVTETIPAGEPFTVQRLRNLGLAHKVDKALVSEEFDDKLLQGMLSAGTATTGLRTSSINNTTIFCSGVTSIDAPHYIEHVVKREDEPLELEDLLDILKREDGIITTAPVLRQLIQRSSLYFVPSLDEMVFLNENEYDSYISDLLGA